MGKLIDKTKGRIKQAVGALTGNQDLKREEAAKDGKDAIKDALK
jgi:uncharacterized protein YjbJ (UPF0337 family)